MWRHWALTSNLPWIFKTTSRQMLEMADEARHNWPRLSGRLGPVVPNYWWQETSRQLVVAGDERPAASIYWWGDKCRHGAYGCRWFTITSTHCTPFHMCTSPKKSAKTSTTIKSSDVFFKENGHGNSSKHFKVCFVFFGKQTQVLYEIFPPF